MENLLKSYTIVPSHLYVQRSADRQVRNIIKDMGRPGYVLVSRQMGKTNLLLNAKRELQNEEDIFVYIDLSNSYESAKSCFENIIDTAIDTHEDIFEQAKIHIIIKRKEVEIPPHKQHTNELISLLKSIKGKLVIILDEIDALTKTNYSDQIFAQIRSIYFSRENYPPLHRLTYLLSGVVEPSEIIKDPKISPFNIGEKIYLNDFTKDEFHQFIEKAKLKFETEVLERIYYWTNGNPRITWDLCSEIQKKLADNKGDLEFVENIVKDLYLTTFDKPPIDNIRELVINDREIRNSIIELNYNKSNAISDRIKSKLYLAGIINYDEKEVYIKNEIIKQSLNLDWIRSLEEDERGLINVAMEEYGKQRYSEALYSFEKFLEDNEFEDNHNKPHYYFIMGHCSFLINNYEKALEYFDKCNFNIEDEPIWYYKVLSQKGLIFFYQNKVEESLKAYKIIIDNGRKDELYTRALLNYGSISLESKKKEYKTDSVEIFNNIINESAFSKEKLKPEFITELKSYAYYNLAQIKAFDNQKEESIPLYKKAYNYAKDKTKPTVVLGIIRNSEDINEKEESLTNIINIILKEGIKPTEFDPESPLDYSFENLKDLLVETYLNFEDTLYKEISSQLGLLGKETISEHLFNSAIEKFNGIDHSKALKIFITLYKNSVDGKLDLPKEIFYYSLKLLAYSNPIKNDAKLNLEYINLFSKELIAKVDYFDLEIFANSIFHFTETNNLSQASEFVEIIKAVKPTVNDNLLINYLLIYHLELNILLLLKQNDKALSVANEILKLANDEKIKKQKSNLLGEKGLDIIKNNAQSIIKNNSGSIKEVSKHLNRRERREQERKNKKK